MESTEVEIRNLNSVPLHGVFNFSGFLYTMFRKEKTRFGLVYEFRRSLRKCVTDSVVIENPGDFQVCYYPHMQEADVYAPYQASQEQPVAQPHI